MLRFIIDTQLPPLLAKYFKEKGFDVLHTTYFPDGHLLSDSQIIEIAVLHNRIIVTKDSDFLDYFLLNGAPPKVLLIQFGNISNKELLANIQLYFNDIHSEFKNGSNLISVNKTTIISY